MGNTQHLTNIKRDKLLQLLNHLSVSRRLASHIVENGHRGLTADELELVTEVETDLEDMSDALWAVYESLHGDGSRRPG